MQSAASLLSAAPKTSTGGAVPNTPGANRPIYLTHQQENEVAFRQYGGLFRKYLSIFPRRFQVAAGTATMVGFGVGLFFLARPRPNVNSPDNVTRTPEWEQATKEYLEKQRISPAHKKSG